MLLVCLNSGEAAVIGGSWASECVYEVEACSPVISAALLPHRRLHFPCSLAEARVGTIPPDTLGCFERSFLPEPSPASTPAPEDSWALGAERALGFPSLALVWSCGVRSVALWRPS